MKFGSLKMPPDAITRTFGIVGQRGTGKSSSAVLLTEQIVEHGGRVVVVDPTGAWWGLRSSADGKSDGIPAVILGGQHGDVPLEATSGQLVADLVVNGADPAIVLDLRLMRKAAQVRFLADFTAELYHANEDPLMVVIDEADRFAPQRPREAGIAPQLLGNIEDIVKLGRVKGLGCTLVTQRPATINKNVLEQMETLVAFRLMGRNDQQAIHAWAVASGDEDKEHEMMRTLANQKPGQAWVWSPAFLEVLEQVRFDLPNTFDSRKTPTKAGQRLRKPKRRTAIDLERLRTEMAEMVEQQEAKDPELLTARIRELERELVEQKPEAVEVEVEVLVPDPEATKDLASHIEYMEALADQLERDSGVLLEEAKALRASLPPAIEAVEKVKAMDGRQRPSSRQRQEIADEIRKLDPGREGEPAESPNLSRAERRILNVLAQFPHGRTKVQLAVLAGYSAKSGGFGNALGKLRSAGLISPAGAVQITPTDLGLVAAGDVDPLPTGAALLEYWKGQLNKAERTILQTLYEAHHEMHKNEIAARTGYSASSGGFGNALGRLRTLQLIVGYGNDIKIADVFYEEG